MNLVVYIPYHENIDELNIYGSKISIIFFNLNFNRFFAVFVKIVTKIRPCIVIVQSIDVVLYNFHKIQFF